MTRRGMSLLVLLAALAPAMAQEKGEGRVDAPEMLSEDYLDRLGQNLKLTDSQRKEVGAVLEKVRPDVKAKWDAAREEEKRIRELQGSVEKALRSAHEHIREKLTDEQKERFDLMRLQARRPPGKRRGPGMRGVDVDPSDIPAELRERMNRGPEFPPEMWEKAKDSEKGEGLPPELREHIEKRLKSRDGGAGKTQENPPAPDGTERP
jgi:hypothetical protein